MADSAPEGASDFNTKMIEEFRANEGRVGGPWDGTTLILIHHIGARSGTERVTPLGCSLQGEGRFAIVAVLRRPRPSSRLHRFHSAALRCQCVSQTLSSSGSHRKQPRSWPIARRRPKAKSS